MPTYADYADVCCCNLIPPAQSHSKFGRCCVRICTFVPVKLSAWGAPSHPGMRLCPFVSSSADDSCSTITSVSICTFVLVKAVFVSSSADISCSSTITSVSICTLVLVKSESSAAAHFTCFASTLRQTLLALPAQKYLVHNDANHQLQHTLLALLAAPRC